MPTTEANNNLNVAASIAERSQATEHTGEQPAKAAADDHMDVEITEVHNKIIRNRRLATVISIYIILIIAIKIIELNIWHTVLTFVLLISILIITQSFSNLLRNHKSDKKHSQLKHRNRNDIDGSRENNILNYSKAMRDEQAIFVLLVISLLNVLFFMNMDGLAAIALTAIEFLLFGALARKLKIKWAVKMFNVVLNKATNTKPAATDDEHFS